jgi:CRP/FNR family cyclic AMP-dependent transcriptional regulator
MNHQDPAIPPVLAQGSLFAGLSADHLKTLASSLRRRRYSRGEVIFRQEDPGSSLYLIESGVVKIVLPSASGKEVILVLLRPGDFFGELALLDGEPRSADAVAHEDCQLLLLQRQDFLDFLEHQSGAAESLLAAVSRRLRRTDLLVHDAAFLDVPARLARTLLELAEAQVQHGKNGSPISLRLTQTELAGMVGTSRESINKWLRYYERHGLVRFHKGLLTVLEPQELRKRILP